MIRCIIIVSTLNRHDLKEITQSELAIVLRDHRQQLLLVIVMLSLKATTI